MIRRTLALCCLLASPLALPAQSSAAVAFEPPDAATPERIVERWTVERLLSAQPRAPRLRPGLQVSPDAASTRPTPATRRRAPLSQASPPLIDASRIEGRILIDPAAASRRSRQLELGNGSPLQPSIRGLAELDHTTSRLVPESARLSYPYSAAGRLFFTIPGVGNFWCSAAAVGPRVIATAGHCVYDAETGRAAVDHLYIPAYFELDAPFGLWAGTKTFTTASWKRGDGSVPNEADIGFVRLADQSATAGPSAQIAVGNLTGWFGFDTNNLFPNQILQLGYPGNIDGGERMQQTHSATGPENPFGEGNVVIGSSQGGGSSGGPWVQNFGKRGSGQGKKTNGAENLIVGVTSWGFVDSDVRAQGASTPAKAAKSAFKKACRGKGNCKKAGNPKEP